MPTFYECDRCTACCRWPGEVKVSDEEIGSIAQFLNLTYDRFVQEFTRLRANRQGLALTDKANEECLFLEQNGNCRIQEVKPRQCREFPNLWNFPNFQAVCKAIPHEVSQQEFDRRLALSVASRPLKNKE